MSTETGSITCSPEVFLYLKWRRGSVLFWSELKLTDVVTSSPFSELTAAVLCQTLFLCVFLRGFIHSIPVFRRKGLGDGLICSQSGKSIPYAICMVLSFMDLTPLCQVWIPSIRFVWIEDAQQLGSSGGRESSEHCNLRKLVQIDKRTENTEKNKGRVSGGRYSGEHSLTLLVATVCDLYHLLMFLLWTDTIAQSDYWMHSKLLFFPYDGEGTARPGLPLICLLWLGLG